MVSNINSMITFSWQRRKEKGREEGGREEAREGMNSRSKLQILLKKKKKTLPQRNTGKNEGTG